MKATIWLALTALMSGTGAHAAVEHISGQAAVIDGDTLLIAGTHIRLSGIDAPEIGQTCLRDRQEWQCGAEATALLTQLISDDEISCISTATSTSNQLVAKCERNGLDLAMVMLEAGLATATDGAAEQYAEVEAKRKAMAVGLWAGQFEAPALWRQRHGPAPVTQSILAASLRDAPPRRQRARESTYTNQHGCAIKGNRNRRGEWIYHLPGRPYYDQTRPEALFCTEAEARQAGYRRSKA